MTELISPCCGKPVTIECGVHYDDEEYQSKWYECSACGKPCDPVQAAENRMTDCIKIQVPEDACHIVLGAGKLDHSHLTEYRTVLGDQIILELNAAGQVIAIELLGAKPCQIS